MIMNANDASLQAPQSFKKLLPGDATLTRRILKRCREANLNFEVDTDAVPIGGGRWGSKVVAYRIPAQVFDEEYARRQEEKEEQRQQAEEAKAKQRLTRCQKRREQFAGLFPQLSEVRLGELARSETAVYGPDQIGYQHGLGTKTYWRQLGFEPVGEPIGILVKGKRLLDVYSSAQLRARNGRISVDQLRDGWTAKYGDERLVLAHALRLGNRLQKVKRHSNLYGLKDRWIRATQDCLIDGRIARSEKRLCWSCSGTGEYGYHENDCDRCGGTGIYSTRTLYEHRFEVAGQRFVFHSYVEPRIISADRGEDLRAYGRPFISDELPCPPQSIVVELIRTMLDLMFPDT